MAEIAHRLGREPNYPELHWVTQDELDALIKNCKAGAYGTFVGRPNLYQVDGLFYSVKD